jgi:hypothetical protein
MADFTGFQVLIQQQQMEQEIESKIERNSSVKGRSKTIKPLKPKLDTEFEENEEPENQQQITDLEQNKGAKSSRFVKRVSLIFLLKYK